MENVAANIYEDVIIKETDQHRYELVDLKSASSNDNPPINGVMPGKPIASAKDAADHSESSCNPLRPTQISKTCLLTIVVVYNVLMTISLLIFFIQLNTDMGLMKTDVGQIKNKLSEKKVRCCPASTSGIYYEIPNQGLVGSTSQTCEIGCRGETGMKGQKGDAGVPGPEGRDGQTGSIGQKGEKGSNGQKGSTGLKGQKGVRGASGSIF